MATYEKASAEVRAVLRDMMTTHHPELVEAGVTVDLLMAFSEVDDAGVPKGPAVKWANYPALAVIRINPLKRRVLDAADAEITIDGREWANLSEAVRNSLIDHEITHLELRLDDEGKLVTDDIGRPKMRMRSHDWQLGGFRGVVQRHGKDAIDYQAVQQLVSRDGQLLFPWAPASDRPFAQAARDLCPTAKGDSVTISALGKSVTLTSETRDRINRALKQTA